MTKISVVRCKSYTLNELADSLKKLLDLLGGISKFVKPGEKILIKPNLLGEHSPDEAVTTHPEIVRTVVRLIKSAGASAIISDCPFNLNINGVFEKTGIKKIASEENAELINPLNYPIMELKINAGKINNVYITKIAFDVDGIINIPKLKTHSLTTLTLGIKNLYGLVPGLIKTNYHRDAHTTALFSKLLSEIYSVIRQKIRFTIIDGITGMDENGPTTGRIRNFNLLAAGCDTVALDTFMFDLFRINIKKMSLLRYCKENNLGETDIKKIEITGDKIEPFDNAILPKTHLANYIPEFVAETLSKFVWSRPKIDVSKCKLCMKCVEACPMKTIAELQHRGKTYLYIDTKNCISCFCCNEVCPHNSVKIVQSVPMTIARKIIKILQ